MQAHPQPSCPSTGTSTTAAASVLFVLLQLLGQIIQTLTILAGLLLLLQLTSQIVDLLLIRRLVRLLPRILLRRLLLGCLLLTPSCAFAQLDSLCAPNSALPCQRQAFIVDVRRGARRGRDQTTADPHRGGPARHLRTLLTGLPPVRTTRPGQPG